MTLPVTSLTTRTSPSRPSMRWRLLPTWRTCSNRKTSPQNTAPRPRPWRSSGYRWRKEVAQLRPQTPATAKQQADFEAVIRKPENAQVLELSVFLNTLLSRKGISWTRILADLEKTMPANVKMLNIQPYVSGRNQVILSLQVGS